MVMVRWEPLRELTSLQNEMNRLFGSFFDAPAANADTRYRWMPAMDLIEAQDAFVLRADLPGLSQDDVEIEFQDNVLTLSGERKADREDNGEGYYRIERATGSFSRSLTLPEGVNPEAVQATFDRGVLEVKIPKPESRKPHRVQIAVEEAQPAIEGTSTEGAAHQQREPAGTPS